MCDEPCLGDGGVPGELVDLQDELEVFPALLPAVQHGVPQPRQLLQLVLDLSGRVVAPRQELLAKGNAFAKVVIPAEEGIIFISICVSKNQASAAARICGSGKILVKNRLILDIVTEIEIN